MRCPLCNKEISAESKLMGHYRIFQPPSKDVTGGEMEICGQCFLLVNILQTLKELKDGIN